MTRLALALCVCALTLTAAGAQTMPPPAASEAGRAPLDVEADRVTLDAKGGEARFEGNVTARQGATRLTCPRLVARMDDAQRLTHLSAEGGVRLEADAAIATARAATWSAAQALLVLEGDVTLTRGADTLSGARLEYHPPTGRVTLERARGRFSAPRLALPPATVR